jgi:insulysin
MLLTQLINEPCFDTLRTKEQLGYLVHSTGRASIGMTGLRISIQSERDAHYLEDRVDAFLNTFEGYLSGMTDEQFEKERASLVNRLREEPKNLVFETTGYWMQIFSGYYDFERKARDADKIEKLSKDDMLQFFQKRISPNSQERAKISVHMQSQHANKATVDAAREAIKAAGAEETEALTAALDAQPSLLADKLVEVAGAELKDAKDVQEKIRNSHAPTSIGDKKEIFTDGQEIRKRMTLGAPASPTDEYKEILAKL